MSSTEGDERRLNSERVLAPFVKLAAQGLVVRRKLHHEYESVAGSAFMLVGWFGIGQLLCSFSEGAWLVVGDILAGQRNCQLDRHALALSMAVDQQSV